MCLSQWFFLKIQSDTLYTYVKYRRYLLSFIFKIALKSIYINILVMNNIFFLKQLIFYFCCLWSFFSNKTNREDNLLTDKDFVFTIKNSFLKMIFGIFSKIAFSVIFIYLFFYIGKTSYQNSPGSADLRNRKYRYIIVY